MTVFLDTKTKIILAVLTFSFGLVTIWCFYLHLKKLCLAKFGTSKEVRKLMRKHNLSRSEAKSHRLQLYQTAIQIKHKRKGTKKDQERERTKPFVLQKPHHLKGRMMKTSSTIQTEV